MIRTTAALAASATVFALLLTGCGNDKATTDAASATTAQSSGDTQVVDSVKAGAFVVSFRGAFPKLAEGKDDAKLSAVLSDSCKDIKAGKPEDEVIQSIIKRASGSTEATPEESKAIYQMAKMMC
ncbi:hypothetical protein F5X71_10785 [Nocardia brasiliensis]|uniref:DUF732 domain-containing protein n=1 Tax=Nocardia brasiliensis TaxID=37326 RepID=A0A6G9XP62_NOCBR|nr:hypothetical protein [Nocardia brasiliensis]QIS02742.1 hypothetical protein F5X71_10785 [Nocardia brasiliensis]